MQDYKENSRRAFDRQAPTYDTASFGSHARGLYPILLSQLAQLPRRRVLDVGCGTGELLRMVGERFPETTRTGLDLSAEMLSVARHKLGEGVELVQGDAERLPFADGDFDVVLCCDSFHHYPNPAAVIAEVSRVLEFGGVFLLGDIWLPLPGRLVMNPFLRWSREGDVKIYSRREITDLLGQAFHQITWRRAGGRAFVARGIR